VDDRLQSVLELAADAGPRLEQGEVERPQGNVLEWWRHVAGGDAQREALDDRGLADAGLAREDRVVLAPARQDVDELADLDVPAQARQVVVADERRQQMAGAHERGAELDRGERPRFLDPAQDARSQRGGPRVTRLQPVERPGEVAAEPGLVDTVMAEDPRDVA